MTSANQTVTCCEASIFAGSSVNVAVAFGQVIDVIGGPAAFRDFPLGVEVMVRAGQKGAGLGWLGRWVGGC